MTPAEKSNATRDEQIDTSSTEDNKRRHEGTSPARKQIPRVGGKPSRIKNMKNEQRGIEDFFIKGRTKLKPPGKINDGDDDDSNPIQGKGRGGTTGDDDLDDSVEEGRFAVNFDAIDVNARKKKNEAKSKKDKVEKAKAA